MKLTKLVKKVKSFFYLEIIGEFKESNIFLMNENTSGNKYLSFLHFHFVKFFKIKQKSKKFKIYKIIEYTRNYVNNKLDILKYFKSFINFKNLTKIILSSQQKKVFKNLCKFKINYQTIYEEYDHNNNYATRNNNPADGKRYYRTRFKLLKDQLPSI